MLRSACSLARWVLAVLGGLALVTSVAAVIPAGCGDDPLLACIAADGSAAATLGVASDVAGESSEGRDDDERDEEDSTDSEEATFRADELRPETVAAFAADRPLAGERAAHGSDRAAHRSALERPPHA